MAQPLDTLPWPDLLRRLHADLEARSRPHGPVRDEEAWHELRIRVRKHAEQALSRRQNIPDLDIDDIVQSVLLKLQSSQSLDRLRAAKFHVGYLIVMVRNAANDLTRRRTLESESVTILERAIREPEGVYQHLAQQQAWQALARELGRLSSSEKALISMRFWQDLRISDIAKNLGLPYSRVAVRLFRLLRRLEKRMQAAGGPGPVDSPRY